MPHDGKRKKAIVQRLYCYALCNGGFEKIRAAVSFRLSKMNDDPTPCNLRLIEQAMSQACSDEDAEKAVKEQRFKLVIADFFVSVLVADYEIGTGDTDDP